MSKVRDIMEPMVHPEEEGQRISMPDSQDLLLTLDEKGESLGLSPEIMEEIIYGEQMPIEGLAKGELDSKRKKLKDMQYDFLDGKIVSPMYEESMHQDVGEVERFALTKFGDVDTDKESAIKYLRKTLKEDTHDIIPQGDRFFIKRKAKGNVPAEETYKVFDPQIMGMRQLFGDQELLNAPVAEILKETARETVEGAVSLAKEIAPKTARILGSLAGAATGPLAFLAIPALQTGAASLTSGAVEALRQKIGQTIGVRSKDLDYDKIMQESAFEMLATAGFGGDTSMDTFKRFHGKKLMKNFATIIADKKNITKLDHAKKFTGFFPRSNASKKAAKQAQVKPDDFMKRAMYGGAAIQEAAEKSFGQQKGLAQRAVYGTGRVLARGLEGMSGNAPGTISAYGKNIKSMIQITQDPASYAGKVMRKVKEYTDASRKSIYDTKSAFLDDVGDTMVDADAYANAWEKILKEKSKAAESKLVHHVEENDYFKKLHRDATTTELPDIPSEPIYSDTIINADGSPKLMGWTEAEKNQVEAMPSSISVRQFQGYMEAIDPSKAFQKESLVGISPREARELVARKDLYFKLKEEVLYKSKGKNRFGKDVGLEDEQIAFLRDTDEYYKDALEMDRILKALPTDPNKRSREFDEKSYEMIAEAKPFLQELFARMDENRFIMASDGVFDKFSLKVKDKGFADEMFNIQTYDRVGDVRPGRPGAKPEYQRVEIDTRSQQTLAGATSVVGGVHYGAARAGVSAAATKIRTKAVAKQVSGYGFLGTPVRKTIDVYKGLMNIPGTIASEASQKLGDLPGLGKFKMIGGDGNVAIGNAQGLSRMIPISKEQVQDVGRSVSRDMLLKKLDRDSLTGSYGRKKIEEEEKAYRDVPTYIVPVGKALQQGSAWGDAR